MCVSKVSDMFVDMIRFDNFDFSQVVHQVIALRFLPGGRKDRGRATRADVLHLRHPDGGRPGKFHGGHGEVCREGSGGAESRRIRFAILSRSLPL